MNTIYGASIRFSFKMLKSDMHGTPMEVDHYRNIKCYKCKQKGLTANRCRKVNAVERRTDRKSYAGVVVKKATF